MSRLHALILGFLVCTSAFSLVFAVREKSEVNDLASSRDQLRATLADARTEIQGLSAKLASLADAAAAQAPAAVSAAPVQPPPVPAPVRRKRAVVQAAASRPRVAQDPRWKHVESQLASHQAQLTAQRERIDQTREDVQRTGDQLDGKINTTRDELNRSIATTHDDVVLLQKRGEHNVHEFDLSKSKQFQRVGPVSLSLRKADTKHRTYDLSLMVDDVPLTKEHVNLFEPVWINLSDRPQPIQLVVNKIEKNHVRGYITEPRYKSAELAGTPAPPAAPSAPGLKQR
jgi:hypothetical protein